MQICLKGNSVLNSFSLDILQSQYVSVGSDWNFQNAINFFSRLYYIENGCGNIYHNGTETLLTPGNVYFIPSGTCFSYHCTDETRMDKIYFHLSLVSLKEQRDIFSDIPKGIYSISADDAKSQNIFEAYQTDDFTGLLSVKSIVFSTLEGLFKKYNWSEFKLREYSQPVLKIMNYIQANLSIRLTIKEISDALFLSESTISKSFKAETGMTVGNYIDDLIFTKTQHLLLQKNYTLKDISRELGFCDQFYFSRRFKEKFGYSPQHYRKIEFMF